MTKLEINTILIKPDNYTYVLHNGTEAVVIDPPESRDVLAHLQERRLTLRMIFATHHHSDHTGGIMPLKKSSHCSVIAADKRVKGVDKVLTDNESIEFNDTDIRVIHVPGHTKGQAAFYMHDQKVLFSGDTLFAAGCGRIFEGGPEQLYNSLQKLASYPDDTMVYCGHEYTLENLEFAVRFEPDNKDVTNRLQAVRELYQQGKGTIPTTIALEKKTNPFLRVHEKSIRNALGMLDRSPIAIFTELRRQKDRF